MRRKDWGQEWRYVQALILFLACLITSGRPTLDSCESDRNCSVQLSSAASLQCTVGQSKECDSIKSTQQPAVHEGRELYLYLATIAVYKRLYHDVNEYEFHVHAFNFSFTVPQAEISHNGMLGVMASFNEAPGYNNNSYYREAICRFFNLSRSSVHILDTFGAQEIPYSCIGININPSVFHLSLMSIPSSSRLHYIVSWHQQPYNEYEYVYNFYEEQGDVMHKSVWVEQLIAVAVIEHRRVIHAVFQLPRHNAGVTFFKVSLVAGLQTLVFKQVGPQETSVTFTDVPPGQYQVVVQPQGAVCDVDLTLCPELASEHVNISQPHDTDSGSSTKEEIVIVISMCAVVFILIIGTMALLVTRKHWKKGETESSGIYITSLACRELEKQVTSYFCWFLSVALHTSVTFTCPLLHPGKLKTINAFDRKTEVETEQNLLQLSPLETCLRCCIILQFSYSSRYCQMEGVTEGHGGPQLEKSVYFKNENLTAVENTLQKYRSKKAYYVTFKQENVPSDVGIAYTINEGSINSVNSDDQITVLNGTFRKPSLKNNFSQKSGSSTPRFHNQHLKEYYLPCDIHNLFEDLRSCLQSKVECEIDSELTNIEYWHLAITVFHKAAEHQPDQTALGDTCGRTSDARTRSQEISETDCVHSQQKTSLIPEYTQSLCTVPGFSASANQIHACKSESSLIVPLSAVEDLYFNSPLSQSKKLCELLHVDVHDITPYNQKLMLLNYKLKSRQGSKCSCDSYSNLTEAENDIAQQCTINQLRS